jgi:hypothetical protein
MAGLHRRAWWRCGVAACGTLATVNTHYRLFYEAADAAGIKKSVTLHTLRQPSLPTCSRTKTIWWNDCAKQQSARLLA